MGCPEATALHAYIEGRSPASERDAMRAHLEQCADCRALVLALDSDTSADGLLPTAPQLRVAPAQDEVTSGQLVGRYLILSRLGAGGMGVVYAAYDPELDRKVALKLIRRVEDGGAVHELQERLVREAQAMARIAHPNVTAVYDVGRQGEQVFVAMELIDGETLAQWLPRTTRSLVEIVDVFARAGRGLAAAHAAGLVHRDFKPNNVMIDGAGRVRVMDFGLARPTGGADMAPLPSPASRLAHELTASGMLLGTPAYMAPEQLACQLADARADQFSFCVGLYEALCGIRPFAGVDTDELRAAIAERRMQRPRRNVPGRLLRAVERGLAPDPEERWPSLDALLAALKYDPVATRRRWLAMGGAVLAVTALVGGPRVVKRHETLVCRGEDKRLAAVWDGPRRSAVHEAFAKSGVGYATDALVRVDAALDAYAQKWTAMSTDSCEATRVRGDQSEEALDLRGECLETRRQELRALVDVLVHADAGVVARAVAAANDLPPLDECANVALLKLPVRPPKDAATRANLDELRRHVADADAMQAAGKYQEGLALAERNLAEANALAYQPEAAAHYSRAILLTNNARFTDGKEALLAAAAAALAAHDDLTATQSWCALSNVVAEDLGRPAEAEPWMRMAHAMVPRLGDDPTTLQCMFSQGVLWHAQARYREAIDVMKARLALQEKLGVAPSRVASTLDELGQLSYLNQQLKESVLYFRRGAALYAQALGPLHPAVADALNNLSDALAATGQLDEALLTEQRALDIDEKVQGPKSPKTAVLLDNMGALLQIARRYEEAIPYHRRAIAIEEPILGASSRLATRLANLGDALINTGQIDEGLADSRRALAMEEAVLGPTHVSLAQPLDGIGRAQTRLGRYDDATASFRRELAIVGKGSGAPEPATATPLRGMAEVLLARRQPALAIEPLEQAIKLRETDPMGAADLAFTRFELARALWESNRDRPRARQLALASHDALALAKAPERRDVDAWLLHHP